MQRDGIKNEEYPGSYRTTTKTIHNKKGNDSLLLNKLNLYLESRKAFCFFDYCLYKNMEIDTK